MVAHALSDTVFGVWVGGAIDGSPELVVGGIEGDDVLDRVNGFVICIGDRESERGVVDLGGGGFGGESDSSWGRIRR